MNPDQARDDIAAYAPGITQESLTRAANLLDGAYGAGERRGFTREQLAPFIAAAVEATYRELQSKRKTGAWA